MKTIRTSSVSICLLLFVFAMIAGPVVAGGGHGSTGEYDQTGPYNISLMTHPEATKIVPDKNLVETVISVTHQGEPAENVTLSYRLDAPPKRFWFGTDFPVVEGTPLLQGTVRLSEGNQMVDLVYPIRGNYTLRTRVTGPEGTAKKKFTIPVSENPQEKLNLGIFLLILFLIGGAGGYFLTTGGVSRRMVAGLALVGLGVMAFNPGTAFAHGKGAYNPDLLEKQIGTTGHTDDYGLHVETFPQPVKVGEMLDVTFHAAMKKAHGHHGHDAGPGDYRAQVNFIHTAGGKAFVKQPVTLHEGTANFQVQLFDGAPHFMMTRIYRPTDPHGEHGDHEEHGEKTGHHAGETAGDGHEHEQGDHAEEPGHEEHAEGQDDGHGHGHGPSRPWEWQGQLDLAPGGYTINFGESGDPGMKWLLLPVGTDHRLETAVESMDGSCETVAPGTVLSADDTCYNLTLKDKGTTHALQVEAGGTYRLFTQHRPAEFNMTIEDAAGNAVKVDREFYPGKGELILTDVRKIDVQAVQPPVDDIIKVLLTLIGVAGLGFVAAWRLKVAMA